MTLCMCMYVCMYVYVNVIFRNLGEKQHKTKIFGDLEFRIHVMM